MTTPKNIVTTVTAIPGHTKKPIVETSLAKAKRLLKKAKIKPEPGIAYVIYECGHIFIAENDPQIRTYYIDAGLSIRSCPKCITKRLVTKYKLCSCGLEYVGKRVVSSNCCQYCPPERKSGREPVRDKKYQNKHLADPSRCFCAYRDECYNKYIEYDALPCKGCLRYKIKHGNYDPIKTRGGPTTMELL